MPVTFLKDRRWRRRAQLKKQPVDEHLALETKCQERLSAPYPVLCCERGRVELFEGRGQEDLDRRGHEAAVVGCDEFALIERDAPVTENSQAYQAGTGSKLEGIP